MDVLWRNREVKINSLEIEQCYFEQKPDTQAFCVTDERVSDAVWIHGVSVQMCVCTCTCNNALYVQMTTLACVSVHVRGFNCMCMCPFWYVCWSAVTFSLEKKAAHCPHAVLGLKSCRVWSETRPAWLELCVSACWSPALFPAVCSAGPSAGTPGTQNPHLRPSWTPPPLHPPRSPTS